MKRERKKIMEEAKITKRDQGRADAMSWHLNAQNPISTAVVARSFFVHRQGGGRGAGTL